MGGFHSNTRGGFGGRGGRSSRGNFRNKSGSSRFGNRSEGNRFGSGSGGMGGYQDRDSDRPREMFDVTCNRCKKRCQVPFRPTGGKPVYCDDCFKKNNDSKNNASSEMSTNLLKEINTKLDIIIQALDIELVEEDSDDEEGLDEDEEDEDYEEDLEDEDIEEDSEDEKSEEEDSEDAVKKFK